MAEIVEPASAFEVLVVGAGPAGMAAACTAAEAGARVGVIDDNLSPGGQIWRGGKAPAGSSAGAWFERLRKAPMARLAGTTVVDAPAPGRLLADSAEGPSEVAYQRLILATGARELFLPFPGWTLPGVVGAGGLQALVKGGLSLAGKRVVVAGSGPLLLAVAAFLREQGADVRMAAEQASWGKLVWFGLGLAFTAREKVQQAVALWGQLHGVRIASGTWPAAAEGEGRLERVVLTDGRRKWTEPCDYLACGFGLVPNLELPALLGCRLEAGFVAVDERQQTSLPGVYAVGELTGIGGLEKSLVEGQIAGRTAASGATNFPLQAELIKRDEARRFAAALARTFALRGELRQLASPETIVCRCEDVAAASLAGQPDARTAKLQTRCGMGPCQGRVCGPATSFLYGWPGDAAPRPPIFPVQAACVAPSKTGSATS